MSLVGGIVTGGCGTVRSHWGIEHEYDFPDGHHYYKPKHKKHKKHKKHHHHHDDYGIEVMDFEAD